MYLADRYRNRTVPTSIGAVLVGTFFLSACGQDVADERDESTAAGGGEAVFAANCAVCHGSGGRGPALEVLKALSPAERAERIRNHPQAGRIPQRLAANELADLIEFLGSDPGEPVAPVFVEQCGACHGGDGRGPALSELKGLSSTEIGNRLRSHPVAGQIPQRLAAGDLADLMEFFGAE